MSKTIKSALAMIKLEDGTYQDRAAVMSAQEREVIKAEAATAYAELRGVEKREKELNAQLELIPVDGVNAARKIGRLIELFIQHDKLQLVQYNSLAVALADAPFNFAKECLSAYKKFEQPVQTADEAKETWVKIKRQLELLPKSGHGKQRGHPEETILDFIGVVIRTAADALDTQNKMPMESWPDFQRNQFEKEGQVIHDMVDKAKEIRLAKEKCVA